jgi:hypothetical protein
MYLSESTIVISERFSLAHGLLADLPLGFLSGMSTTYLVARTISNAYGLDSRLACHRLGPPPALHHQRLDEGEAGDCIDGHGPPPAGP